MLLSQFPEELVGEKAEPQSLFDAVNFLFSLQVRTHFVSLVTLKIAARLIFVLCKFTKSLSMAPFFFFFFFFFFNFPKGKSGGLAIWEPAGAEEWLEVISFNHK